MANRARWSLGIDKFLGEKKKRDYKNLQILTMPTKDTQEEDWRKEFHESDVLARIISCDTFAQMHGYAPYEGETIESFISKTIAKERAEAFEEGRAHGEEVARMERHWD